MRRDWNMYLELPDPDATRFSLPQLVHNHRHEHGQLVVYIVRVGKHPSGALALQD